MTPSQRVARGKVSGEANMREARSAVVTGASGMIGTATVRLLAERGCAVLAVDRAPSPVPQDGVTFMATDIAQLKSVAAVADQAAKLFGTADALIHIAGGAGPTRAPDLKSTDLSTWEDVMALNVTSAFLLCRALVPPMRRQGWAGWFD